MLHSGDANAICTATTLLLTAFLRVALFATLGIQGFALLRAADRARPTLGLRPLTAAPLLLLMLSGALATLVPLFLALQPSLQGNSMPHQELLPVPAPLPESSGLMLTHESQGIGMRIVGLQLISAQTRKLKGEPVGEKLTVPSFERSLDA